MLTFKSWKVRIIAGTAILGWLYGLMSAVSHNILGTSLIETTISILGSTAFFASAGSALCRAYEVCLSIRHVNDRPSDPTLCYRGVCKAPLGFSPISDLEAWYYSIDNSLSLQGGVAHLPSSSEELDHECKDRPVRYELCYRGIGH